MIYYNLRLAKPDFLQVCNCVNTCVDTLEGMQKEKLLKKSDEPLLRSLKSLLELLERRYEKGGESDA